MQRHNALSNHQCGLYSGFWRQHRLSASQSPDAASSAVVAMSSGRLVPALWCRSSKTQLVSAPRPERSLVPTAAKVSHPHPVLGRRSTGQTSVPAYPDLDSWMWVPSGRARLGSNCKTSTAKILAITEACKECPKYAQSTASENTGLIETTFAAGQQTQCSAPPA